MDIRQLQPPYIIGILGGTGKEGFGLAYQWSQKGHKINIGSRDKEKAMMAAEKIRQLLPGSIVSGETNLVASKQSDIIVACVPYNAHYELLNQLKDELRGKILIDVTVPLMPPKVTTVRLPPAGSAALEARQILGEDVDIVSAFQNISYENLLRPGEVSCDVLVSGGSKFAKKIVLELVKDAGLIGWDAGPLENSVVAEGLTSILIGINKQYGVHSSGIKITGVPRENYS